jgi:hypothetical protein
MLLFDVVSRPHLPQKSNPPRSRTSSEHQSKPARRSLQPLSNSLCTAQQPAAVARAIVRDAPAPATPLLPQPLQDYWTPRPSIAPGTLGPECAAAAPGSTTRQLRRSWEGALLATGEAGPGCLPPPLSRLPACRFLAGSLPLAAGRSVQRRAGPRRVAWRPRPRLTYQQARRPAGPQARRPAGRRRRAARARAGSPRSQCATAASWRRHWNRTRAVPAWPGQAAVAALASW